MRVFEKKYLERIKQRDLIEKKLFKPLYEDFDRYNKEIVKLTNKNNELQVIFGMPGSE
jgi:hypothetical protein